MQRDTVTFCYDNITKYNKNYFQNNAKIKQKKAFLACNKIKNRLNSLLVT